MLLPLMGLFMVGIPIMGFFAGIFCLCVKRLRFLAPFAFMIPVSGSYAVIFGFWGAAMGLESLGASAILSGIGGLIGLFLAGGFGTWMAYRFAERLRRKLSLL